jgi:hypothetical protein
MDEAMVEALAEMQRLGRLDAMAVVTRIEGSRQQRNGQVRGITITVYDVGPAGGTMRYAVVVEDDEGRQAHGLSRPTLLEAVRQVPWENLDTDHPPQR